MRQRHCRGVVRQPILGRRRARCLLHPETLVRRVGEGRRAVVIGEMRFRAEAVVTGGQRAGRRVDEV